MKKYIVLIILFFSLGFFNTLQAQGFKGKRSVLEFSANLDFLNFEGTFLALNNTRSTFSGRYEFALTRNFTVSVQYDQKKFLSSSLYFEGNNNASVPTSAFGQQVVLGLNFGSGNYNLAPMGRFFESSILIGNVQLRSESFAISGFPPKVGMVETTGRSFGYRLGFYDRYIFKYNFALSYGTALDFNIYRSFSGEESSDKVRIIDGFKYSNSLFTPRLFLRLGYAF
jgi:hypothetical protein